MIAEVKDFAHAEGQSIIGSCISARMRSMSVPQAVSAHSTLKHSFVWKFSMCVKKEEQLFGLRRIPRPFALISCFTQ